MSRFVERLEDHLVGIADARRRPRRLRWPLTRRPDRDRRDPSPDAPPDDGGA